MTTDKTIEAAAECPNCKAWKAEVHRLRTARPRLTCDNAEPATLDEIIQHLKEHQWTHTDWATWFEEHPDDPRIEAVGSADFHRNVEARYSRMISGLKAFSTPGSRLPGGLVVVPMEPTEAMMKAPVPKNGSRARAYYRAMLSALEDK